jgi:hypothetical protein
VTNRFSSLGATLRGSVQELVSPFGRRSPLFIGFLCLAAAIPAYFAIHTHLAWEDFFITYRYSENLARGHGLVYNSGERVYGFTSPLNTLIPAFFAAVLAARDFVVPLWLYRCVSLVGLLFASVSIVNVFSRGEGASRIRILVGFVFPVIAALEIKSTAFAMSGQEAGLVLGFLAPAFAIAALGWVPHRILGGILWAGLLYSRPDAFVYMAAIAIAAVAFSPGPRKPLISAFIQSALICGLLYLPWLLFTGSYYGSPVPHTIIAKHNLIDYAHNGFGMTAALVAGFRAAPSVVCRALAPIYDQLSTGAGSWPPWLHDAELVLGLAAVSYWLVPSRDRFGRMASLVSFVLLLYLIYTDIASQYCPWYYPPLAFMCLVTLASAAATLAERFTRMPARAACAGALIAGLLFFLGFIFVSSLAPIRFKQDVIDSGQRRQIGLWLKAHVAENEFVYLEPLGYIGYFSERRMVDWPGLVSPAVVEARRKIGPKESYFTWAEVAELIKPPWIVARANESMFMGKSDYLSHNYELMAVFDDRKAIDALGAEAAAPGMNLAYPEALFVVYRRTGGSGLH